MKFIAFSLFLMFICQIISIEEVRIDMREYSKDKNSMAMATRDAQININLIMLFLIQMNTFL